MIELVALIIATVVALCILHIALDASDRRHMDQQEAAALAQIDRIVNQARNERRKTMNNKATTTLSVKRLHPDAIIPTRAHPRDAGLDMYATETVTLSPGQRHLTGTGIAIALTPGTVGLIHPRSGLAKNHGISIVNAPGTIDAGYTGEIKVNLINLDPEDSFTITKGDRIAQLVIQHALFPELDEVDTLDPTDRGDRGHGSTGN